MTHFLRNNRGSVFSVLTAVFVAVFSVFFLYSLYKGGAEAVIGGVGNVTDFGNPHNLSSNSSGIKAVDEDRICVFCHTPHSAISTSEDADLLDPPLWNHELSSEFYNVRSPGNFANTVGGTIYNVTLLVTVQQPDGTSKLCLSCHDGTVSIGAVRSEISNIAMVSNTCLDADGSLSASCSVNIGNDLTQKHSVSIPMNDSLISNSIANCTNGFQTFKLQYPWSSGVVNGARVILRPTSRTYGAAGVSGSVANAAVPNKYGLGYNYGVQCSTCHDPHHWTSGNSTPRKELEAFLVAGENDLCNSCHTPC